MQTKKNYFIFCWLMLKNKFPFNLPLAVELGFLWNDKLKKKDKKIELKNRRN